MIVSTILNIQKLEPDNWDRWWDIWHKHAAPLHKTRQSPNSQDGLHIGFDAFRLPQLLTSYEAPAVNLESLYPSLYNQIIALPFPILGARFVMSRGDFPAHVDNRFASWSVRCMFHNTDPNPQWYFTRKDGTDRKWLTLPEETNWFAYEDGTIKHGTIYVEEHPKILLQIFPRNPFDMARFVKSSFSSYPNHNIEFD